MIPSGIEPATFRFVAQCCRSLNLYSMYGIVGIWDKRCRYDVRLLCVCVCVCIFYSPSAASAVVMFREVQPWVEMCVSHSWGYRLSSTYAQTVESSWSRNLQHTKHVRPQLHLPLRLRYRPAVFFRHLSLRFRYRKEKFGALQGCDNLNSAFFFNHICIRTCLSGGDGFYIEYRRKQKIDNFW
jgi:hypothetical protein